MQYFVLDQAGNQYGPADIPTLQQWAQEGRLNAQTMLRDAATGETLMAGSVPGLLPTMAPPQPGPYSPPPAGSPYGSSPYVPPQGYGAYPRGGYGNPEVDKNLQSAWIFGALSLVCCGIIFGALGISYANKVINAGDTRGRGPLILSWIGLILSVLAIIANLTVFRRF